MDLIMLPECVKELGRCNNLLDLTKFMADCVSPFKISPVSGRATQQMKLRLDIGQVQKKFG